MLPFSRPSCYFKTRPPSCALGTSFYTVSEGRDLMTYVSDNYTSYSAPSPLRLVRFDALKGENIFFTLLKIMSCKVLCLNRGKCVKNRHNITLYRR